jgi:hypothetical protein
MRFKNSGFHTFLGMKKTAICVLESKYSISTGIRKPADGQHLEFKLTNGTGRKQMPAFSNFWHVKCSGGARQRA